MMTNISTSSIPKSWQLWITENLQRGVTHESLLQSMLAHQFDSIQSQATITFLASKLNTPQLSTHNHYIYQPAKILDGHTLDVQGKKVRVLARINKPVIVLFDNFLTAVECNQLIALAQQKLQPSTIVDAITGQFTTINNRRSYGTHFALCETDLIKTLDQRMAALMNWPIENGEGLQVLNYSTSGEYKEHFDYFDPDLAGSQQQIKHGGNRVATLIIYLNNVKEGGETLFPKIGFSAVPKQGSAIYFEYLNHLGQLDKLTLHAGTPVTAGEKWIATKWVRERRYE